MKLKMQVAAIAAALVLAACTDGYAPTPGNDAALSEEMLQTDPMLQPGAIDDATGTEIP